MQELSRKQKTEIVESLPKDLLSLLESEDTGIFLLSLSEQYGLDEEKLNLLSKIIGNVALGLLPLTNLAQEINTQITPDMQIALRLAQDLNIELFFPVMESLKQAPTIANAVLTGQPTMPAMEPISPTPMAPIAKPALVVPPAVKMPEADQYREPAEAISGPLKPKIGPEPMSAPRPVAPPVVTLRSLETMAPPPIAPTPAPIPPAFKPAPVAAPIPAPMPVPPAQQQFVERGSPILDGRQTITVEGGTPPQAVVKVPLPTPAPQPAPIKVPVASTPALPTPIPAQTPALPILPPTPSELQNRGSSISQPNPKDLGEIGTKPLTFTRPVMPPTPVQPAPAPIPVPAVKPNLNPITYNLKPDSYREPVEFAPLPVPPQLPTEEMAHPTIDKQQTTDNKTMPTKQFIASPAETPIDLEELASDIVDLRQDKGRF